VEEKLYLIPEGHGDMTLALCVVRHGQSSHLLNRRIREVWPPVDRGKHRVEHELLDLLAVALVLGLEDAVGHPPVVSTKHVDGDTSCLEESHLLPEGVPTAQDAVTSC